MSLNLCVSARLPNSEYYANVFDKQLRAHVKSITIGSTPAEFQAVKQDKSKIVMFVDGPISHDIIKDLCDDYTLPKDQRRVQWIYSLTAGVDAYRLGELTKELADVPFMNAHGCYSSILAEHVIYSMLYFNRKTWRLQSSRAAHKWDPFDMMELRGQSMGIIGYGDIGQATAKLARAFGMEVTGVKRTKPSSDVDDLGVKLVHGDAERDRVIRESDFVVGILPGTDETKQFFNKDRFAMMKQSAVFINIGRGITQCEKGIVEALRNGVIRGAAVDVFEKEPLPADSEMWSISEDKLLLTPHSADRSADLLPSSVKRFIAFFMEYLKSNKLDGYRVDIKKGY